MSEVKQIKQRLDGIESAIKKSDKQNRITSAVQIAAIGLLFLFGVSTLDDLFKKLR